MVKTEITDKDKEKEKEAAKTNLTKLITQAIFKNIQQKAILKGVPLVMDKSHGFGKLMRSKLIQPQELNYKKMNVTFDEENPKFKIKHKILNKNYLLIPEEEEKVLIMPVRLPLSLNSPSHIVKFNKQSERRGITTPQPMTEELDKAESLKTSKAVLRK